MGKMEPEESACDAENQLWVGSRGIKWGGALLHCIVFVLILEFVINEKNLPRKGYTVWSTELKSCLLLGIKSVYC